MERYKNVFVGDTAVSDFIDPDKLAYLPLVEIPAKFNPFARKGIRIFFKMMQMHPLQNVKALPALSMLKEKGRQLQGAHLIENSSGNTVSSLATIGRIFGAESITAIVSNEISMQKLNMLRFFGLDIEVNLEPICPEADDPKSGIYKAKQRAKKKGWINPGQYNNEKNPDAHYSWTGPQIYDQLEGKIDYFVSGMGTTGTLVGTSRYLKEKIPSIKTIGVVRAFNNPIPGPRTKTLLRQVDFAWKENCDEVVEVTTVDAFKMSLDLCREGLLVGPSSGMSLVGALQILQQKYAERDNIEKTINVVIIACDGPFVYLEDYFKYLPAENFSEVKNKELLTIISSEGKSTIPEITVDDLHKRQGAIDSRMLILDVRDKSDFTSKSIENSYNISDSSITEIKNLIKRENKQIVIVCRRGVSSLRKAEELYREGIKDVYSLKGGIVEWLQKSYPVVRNSRCAIN